MLAATLTLQTFFSLSSMQVLGLLRAVAGKGSSVPNHRFYGTSPPKPMVGMAPLGTDWASPSEDNIHVSDNKVVEPDSKVDSR